MMFDKKTSTENLSTPVNVEDVIPGGHIVLSSGQRWQGFQCNVHHHQPYGFDETSFEINILTLSLGNTIHTLKQIKDGKRHEDVHVKNDITLNPAYAPESQYWDCECHILNVFFKPWFIKRVIADSASHNPERIELLPIFKARDPFIENIGQALLCELQTEGLCGRLYAESLATALAVHLLRQYSTSKPNIRQYEDGLPRYKLQQALEYIDAHIEQDIQLADLAELLGMSRYYFVRLFKQSMGVTPYQYVLQQRVERAKVLLKHRERAISDIALECGFANQSHFTKNFRQLTGVTPKVYRQR
jgi:AraC family transcriptional regulator